MRHCRGHSPSGSCAWVIWERLNLHCGSSAPEQTAYAPTAVLPRPHCLTIYRQNPALQVHLVQALHGSWPEVNKPGAGGPQRYGRQASHWVRVEQSQSLREVLLQPDHIVPGLPLFWVVAAGTDYRTRFLAEELKRF